MTYPKPRDSDHQWKPDSTRQEPNTEDVTYDEVYPPEHDPVWLYMDRDVFIHIARYVRNVANWMGLRDWTLSLSWTPLPDDEEAIASVNVVYGQRYARVSLQQSFAYLPFADQTHALVHELMHLHIDPLQKLICNTLPSPLGDGAYRVFRGAFDERIEQMTDAIARELARRLPGIETDWKFPEETTEKENEGAAD